MPAMSDTPLFPEIPPEQSLIEYPSDFPIKIMGLMHDDFERAIVDLVLRHDPSFHVGKLEKRPSAKGNYLGLTVTVLAVNREQLDNLYRELSAHPMVKMVL
jgi:putative lipoic acid-binding regulatory protein